MPSSSPALQANGPARFSPVFMTRAIAAVVQAAALYLLLDVFSSNDAWVALSPALLVPLLFIAIYVPLVVMIGAGQMQRRTHVIWTIVAGVVVALLGLHEATRGRVAEWAGEDVLMPRAPLLLATAAALFTAHVLVVDGAAERRLLPSYERHFNTAWKLGLQICLAAAFVGVFWIMLKLGSELFRMLGLFGFSRLINQGWFVYPATTLALAAALHITDVQPSLIRGVRSIVLTLFSWLLPVMAAIVLAFLCCLPFTTLAPLWGTRFATSLLITTMAALVMLINSHYQDGAPEHTASRIKRVAACAGAIMLLPLAGLAVRALWLRVDQYGWSAERILGGATVAIAACYALGYAAAALRAPARLKFIETTNVAGAYLAIAVMLAVFSPLADPARLMVASQVERLRSGAVEATKFDYTALKYDGASWGMDALEKLSRQQDGPDAKEVRLRSDRVLESQSRYDMQNDTPATPENLAKRIVMLTPGRELPKDFLTPDFWNSPDNGMLQCMANDSSCTAMYLPLQTGKPDSLLIVDPYNGAVFDQDADGKWKFSASLAGNNYCAPLQKAMRQGKLTAAPHAWNDLLADGVRFVLIPSESKCPPDWDKKQAPGTSSMMDAPAAQDKATAPENAQR